MKNKFLLLVFILFLLILLFNKFVLQIVWINPNVNTQVFPYITKPIKELDKALNYSITSIKTNKSDAKIIYQNAYGSGFLKNNSIPNDLDYSVGVYLGEYEYDGTNAEKIANEIEKHMTSFQLAFYNYITEYIPDKFYTDSDTFQALQKFNNNKWNNIEAITKSIPNLFNKKDYVVYTSKSFQTDASGNKINVMFPFILRKNEILIEDYSPITLFSDTINYSNKTRNFLREITVVTDFYADIKQGNEVIHSEIVAESFQGQRLQLSRRFFVPNIFIGNNSAQFLKNFELLNNNDKYIEYRMFNFRRHIQEISNLSNMKERPIKLLKRILQATDLILPAIDKETAKDINTTVEELLNNNQIRLINDYETAYSNLLQIVSNPILYNNIGATKLNNHIDAIYNIVSEMEDSKLFEDKVIAETKKITNELKKEIKSEKDLNEYSKKIMSNAELIYPMLDKTASEIIPEKIYGYSNIFLDTVKQAGFHQIDMCWLDKNLIGIVKDDFTSQIPKNKLKEMALQNNLINAEYKFINKSELYGPKVRYAVWVRFNSTDSENKNWDIVKTKLLTDKSNFNIKRTLSIPIIFSQK